MNEIVNKFLLAGDKSMPEIHLTFLKKHLTLLKILNIMGIKEGLLLWFINFLIKCLNVVVLIYD